MLIFHLKTWYYFFCVFLYKFKMYENMYLGNHIFFNNRIFTFKYLNLLYEDIFSFFYSSYTSNINVIMEIGFLMCQIVSILILNSELLVIYLLSYVIYLHVTYVISSNILCWLCISWLKCFLISIWIIHFLRKYWLPLVWTINLLNLYSYVLHNTHGFCLIFCIY